MTKVEFSYHCNSFQQELLLNADKDTTQKSKHHLTGCLERLDEISTPIMFRLSDLNRECTFNLHKSFLRCVTRRQDTLTTKRVTGQRPQYLHLPWYTNLELSWLPCMHNLINFSIYTGFPEYSVTRGDLLLCDSLQRIVKRNSSVLFVRLIYFLL